MLSTKNGEDMIRIRAGPRTYTVSGPSEPAERPKFRQLKVIAAEYGFAVSVLRREIAAGRLKAMRPTSSKNAPLYLCDDDMEEWIQTHGRSRQFVEGPSSKG